MPIDALHAQDEPSRTYSTANATAMGLTTYGVAESYHHFLGRPVSEGESNGGVNTTNPLNAGGRSVGVRDASQGRAESKTITSTRASNYTTHYYRIAAILPAPVSVGLYATSSCFSVYP